MQSKPFTMYKSVKHFMANTVTKYNSVLSSSSMGLVVVPFRQLLDHFMRNSLLLHESKPAFIYFSKYFFVRSVAPNSHFIKIPTREATLQSFNIAFITCWNMADIIFTPKGNRLNLYNPHCVLIIKTCAQYSSACVSR